MCCVTTLDAHFCCTVAANGPDEPGAARTLLLSLQAGRRRCRTETVKYYNNNSEEEAAVAFRKNKSFERDIGSLLDINERE